MNAESHIIHPLSDRDEIHGGDGDDVLIGNDDHDRLFGESGADRFIAESKEVHDLDVNESFVLPTADEFSLNQPRSVDFESELPRLPTGKLYKRLLKDRYWGNRDSRIV